MVKPTGTVRWIDEYTRRNGQTDTATCALRTFARYFLLKIFFGISHRRFFDDFSANVAERNWTFTLFLHPVRYLRRELLQLADTARATSDQRESSNYAWRCIWSLFHDSGYIIFEYSQICFQYHYLTIGNYQILFLAQQNYTPKKKSFKLFILL